MDWAAYPPVLLAVAERFQGVLIENRPALDVLRQHDGPDTLHFVDPPYVHSTRSLRGVKNGCYRHEMDDAGHAELLQALQALQGMVVLSGYESGLYADALPGWHAYRTRARISAGRGTGIRTEVAWVSPACQRALARAAGGLFAEVAS
jgi:DNA adenine methylase